MRRRGEGLWPLSPAESEADESDLGPPRDHLVKGPLQGVWPLLDLGGQRVS